MHDIQNIITERVDDIPLLLEHMQRMELPTLIDTHFPAHGNWYGLSLGWVSLIWLSSILSRGDHRLVHVEPWVANRLFTLQTVTGQAVERLDFTDDGCLAYTNKRMIGRVGLVEDAADFIADEKLGPDALDRRFDFDAFKIAAGQALTTRAISSSTRAKQIAPAIAIRPSRGGSCTSVFSSGRGGPRMQSAHSRPRH